MDTYGNCRHCKTVTDLHIVPRVGFYCSACFERLSQTTLYAGAITGASLVERANGLDQEVAARTARLRAQATAILEQ